MVAGPSGGEGVVLTMNIWRKGIAQWHIGNTMYLSVPFTWLMDDVVQLALAHRGPVIAGGPAVDLLGIPDGCLGGVSPIEPLLFHNPCATYTTRGCPNQCSFCAVPRIEGEFRELAHWRAAPIICDNNLLAASRIHFTRVIDSLRPFPACDFNQGFGAELFTSWHAAQIAQLRHAKIRFSLDHSRDIDVVGRAVEIARKAGLKDIGIYVLIGYDDTPTDALARLEFVRGLDLPPNPMRYQPLNARRKNEYIAPGWTDRELRRMMRYYSRLNWFEHIPFDEFDQKLETMPLFSPAESELF